MSLLGHFAVKKYIEKAVDSSLFGEVKTDDNELATYEKVKFDIEFSDNGIQVQLICLSLN